MFGKFFNGYTLEIIWNFKDGEMKKLNILIMVGCALVMGACATGTGIHHVVTPNNTGGLLSIPKQFQDFKFARSFAGPQTWIEPAPTAVLLLTKNQDDRNKAVCDAFLKVETIGQIQEKSPIDSNIIVTRMLLQTNEPYSEKLNDCSYLLSIYDYERSNKLLKDLGISEKEGPFFVTFFPLEAGMKERPFLVADASEISTEKELQAFVQQWQTSLNKAVNQLVFAENILKSNSPPVPDINESHACAVLGKAVKVAAPILLEMAVGAITTKFPEAKIFFGTTGENGKVTASWQLQDNKLVTQLGDGTTAMCTSLLSWIKTKLQVNS